MKKKRNFKKILLLISGLMIVMAIYIGKANLMVVSTFLSMGNYSVEPADENLKTFTNHVDGYRLNIPKNMSVDMKLSKIRTVFENKDLRLEIYRQTVADPQVYIGYSNRFIENSIDHKKEYEGNIKVDGLNAFVLQWFRQKLKYIQNDRNYYASVDIPVGNREVYSLFFKSNIPFSESNDYRKVVNSFTLIDKTKEASVHQFKGNNKRIWSRNTKTTFERFFGDDSSLTWGIFEPSAPVDFSHLKKLEKKLNYQFPFLILYKNFNKEGESPNLLKGLENANKEGRILELTLQTVDQDEGEGNMVYDVLDGKYDQFLHHFAGTVAKVDHPVLFRLCNEMNGDWCPYSSFHTSKDTEIFKAFYQYVYQVFKEEGALDHVIWVWNPNGRSFPNFKFNDEALYYPGNQYVDVVGLTGYNTGTYYMGEKWQSFAQIYDPVYQKAVQLFHKPLMITEFASSSVGGDKGEWINRMFKQISKYEKIKVAIWWNGRDLDTNGHVARPYWLDETEILVQIFKENLKAYQK